MRVARSSVVGSDAFEMLFDDQKGVFADWNTNVSCASQAPTALAALRYLAGATIFVTRPTLVSPA